METQQTNDQTTRIKTFKQLKAKLKEENVDGKIKTWKQLLSKIDKNR